VFIYFFQQCFSVFHFNSSFHKRAFVVLPWFVVYSKPLNFHTDRALDTIGFWIHLQPMPGALPGLELVSVVAHRWVQRGGGRTLWLNVSTYKAVV